MDPISTLIFNALVRRQSINLPGIGSLKVITRPPMMEKKGMITPPLNLVIYAETESPEFLNIVTLIAQNTNQDEAQAIYNDWLTTVRHEEVIRIESVGEIREKRFYPAQGLNEIMNPIRPEPVKMPHQMGVRQIVLWVIGAVIIGGAISYGAITLLNRSTYSYEEDLTEWDEPAPATSAAPSSELATDQPAATTDEATNGPATTATPTPAPTAPSKPAISAPSAPSTVAAGQMGYYVVVGTYSSDANANKFIAQAKRIDNTLSYYKLPLGNGKIMIYTSVSATEQQAKRLKQQCAGSFPDAWVFKRKVR